MAGGMDLGTSGRGGKKPLDAAINLVPFIDLMAVTISFLIMTAVWTDIGRLQVAQSSGGAAATEPTVVLTARVSTTKIELWNGGQVVGTIVIADGVKKTRELLRAFKSEFPTTDQVTVVIEDDVSYERIVGFIDECVGAGMANVSLEPAT